MGNLIQPSSDRLLVRPIKAAESVGGVHLPEQARERPQEAIVVAAGPGRTYSNGVTRPIEAQPGDRILMRKFSGEEIRPDGVLGETLWMIREEHILGVIVVGAKDDVNALEREIGAMAEATS